VNRKPIGMAALSDEMDPNGRVWVVCDDGSCWSRRPGEDEWLENPPLPGSDRAIQKAQEAMLEVKA
jgi:hypothetical protein